MPIAERCEPRRLASTSRDSGVKYTGFLSCSRGGRECAEGPLEGTAEEKEGGRRRQRRQTKSAGRSLASRRARASLDALAARAPCGELQFPYAAAVPGAGAAAAWACLPTLTGELAAAGALSRAPVACMEQCTCSSPRGHDLEPRQEPSRGLVAGREQTFRGRLPLCGSRARSRSRTLSSLIVGLRSVAGAFPSAKATVVSSHHAYTARDPVGACCARSHGTRRHTQAA